VNRVGPEQAHRLLEQSFAQYQADRSVVSLVRGVERGQRMLDEVAAELGGNDAPILEYARLREQISQHERAQARASRLQRRQAVNDALAALRRGDIITITHGRRGGLAVVLEPARDGDDPRPLVLTENRWAGRISSADYSGASAPVGSMTLPKRIEHRQPRVRRDLASALRSAAVGLRIPDGRRGGGRHTEQRDLDPELVSLRDQMRRHPAHREPDREIRVRVAERYLRIERDNEVL
jgi:ATP-dependent RNA helicase HelY